MSGYQSSNFAGEIWFQWFGCCTNQPAHQRKRQAVQRSRVRIDRSMIGYPMNFQHTVHIGSGDLEVESSHLDALQGQMQSKGGYGKAYVVKVRQAGLLRGAESGRSGIEYVPSAKFIDSSNLIYYID